MPRKPRYLLCPPDHFRVEYAINPWMGGTVDSALAHSQWFELEDAIIRAGGDVAVIAPSVDLPDMVFAANAGAVKDGRVVLSNYRYPERKPEAIEYERWFKSEGFTVNKLPPLMYFEGCGDVEFVGDVMVAGHGFRSDLPSITMAARILGASDFVPLKLVDQRFYHLDTCFLYLGGPKKRALYWPGAFDPAGLRALGSVVNLRPISEVEAMQFVCNSVVIGDTIIMPQNTAPVTDWLRSEGWHVVMIDTSEFMKAGGSLRCLSLDVNK